MSKIHIEEHFGPLFQFIHLKTGKFRKATANPKAQVVILTDEVLKEAKVPEKDFANFRKMAFAWAKKWNSESSLNDHMAQIPGKEYIVLKDFGQVGSFFRAARRYKFLKSGSVLHRGHVTAVVREAAESAARDSLQNLENAGTDPRILKIIEDRMYAKLEAVQPALNYKLTRHIDNRMFNNKLEYTIIFPELKKANLGKKEEAALYFAVEEATNQFVELYKDKLVDLKGSKSIIKATSETVTEMLIGKGVKGYKKTDKGRLKGKRTAKRVKTKAAVIPRLRDEKGQFTSAMNIQAILDQRIKQQVQDNMGQGGALVNRTGRFAQSVSVEKVMQSRQGVLTAFYTYMKSPYQTFERGYAQGSLRRDPRKIISRSIREIAMETLNHKLPIRTRRV
jgi:hypothetical protein